MSKKITIVGSGNWGSAIAKVIGSNVANMKGFDPTVTMYVYEEIVDGKKLTEIINSQHENVKYLPGISLPSNVYAEPDLEKSCKDADFLIFVVPHQFITRICETIKNKIKPTAVGVSLIKGFVENPGGGIKLVSHLIKEELNIDVAVLMGANIANEVAKGEFCETTVGCKDLFVGRMLKEIMETENFRVTVVSDTDTVEVCGALKNIVACAAGFADGLGLGDNTKAAVIRIGLMEMIQFVELFYGGGKLGTFFESCGVADLVTTCYGGRNRRCSELFVKLGKPLKDIEDEVLKGQKLQGPLAAAEVMFMLESKQAVEKFPLFAGVHYIFQKKMEPLEMIKVLRNHPVHNCLPGPSSSSPQGQLNSSASSSSSCWPYF